MNDAILRTPIIKRLTPDQWKIYQVADPHSVGTGGYATGGWQGSNTYGSVVTSVGYQMVYDMIYANHQWLDAAGAHDPEMVWYQGAYATGASTIAQGKFMSEAYAQFPAFHFTIPSVPSGLSIQAVKVYYLNMGATLAFGPSLNANANNRNIKTSAGWDGSNWWVNFHVLNTPTCNYHIQDINNNSPCDSVDIASVGSQGDFKGYRDIFLKAPLGTCDGCIPILTNPVRESYYMSASTLAHFTSTTNGWIVPTFHPTITSTTSYRPQMGVQTQSGTDNYWGCASLRDIYIDIEIDVT